MAWASNSNSDSMIRTFHFVGLALALVLTAGTSAHAQTRTAVFEDGSKLDYNVLSESPEDLKPMWLHWGTFSEGALYGAQVDKWIPGKARIQFTTSLIGANSSMSDDNSEFVDGTSPAGRSWRLRGHVFLSSWTKTKTKRLSLQSKSTGYNEVTRYTVEMDVPRNSYLAFHGGVSYQNLAAVESVSYGELALGVSLVRARHIDFEVYDEGKAGAVRQRGGSFMELYADALIFNNPAPFLLSTQEYFEEDGLEARPVGMEIAWKGVATATGKGGFGLWLKAGMMVGPYRTTGVFGGGFSFALMDDARQI